MVSQVLKVLNKTYSNMKRKPVLHDLNPKAVTNDELFGIINPSTREWKDGELIIHSQNYFYSRTTPHQINIKLNFCPPGPLSLGQLPTTTHYQPVNPLIETNTCMVGNCPGGELSGYDFYCMLLSSYLELA